MKKLFAFVIASGTILLFDGCKKAEKNVEDYFPKIAQTSAQVLPDGSIGVAADVTEGKYGLEYVGFCADTIPNADIDVNQLIVDSKVGNTYATKFLGLNGSKTYYVRAWAANQNGYTVGEEIVITPWSFDSSAAECWPGKNKAELESGSGTSIKTIYKSNVDEPEISNGNWVLEMRSEDFDLYIELSQRMGTGVYEVTDGSFDEGKLMARVYFSYWFSDKNRIEAGSKVYIKNINSHTWEVMLCGGKYDNYKFNARFITGFD